MAFNASLLVTKCFATIRKTGDEKLLGKVDRMDIRAGITRLAIYGALNINHRLITDNLDGSCGVHEYLEKL
jgi:hypothetical protein